LPVRAAARKLEPVTIYTIGHSTRSGDALIALLRAAGVDLLVDVRGIPRSRANPQFNAEVLPAALERAGIGYRHLAALGGRRGVQTLGFASPNGAWRNRSFRNYADYALTPPFRAGLAALLELAQGGTCAVMCAEAVWWRCHRQIVADHLIAAGREVVHLLGPGRSEAARLNPAARLQADASVHYPGEQGELF